MKTITLQIGNSDDKLSQRDWSYFVNEIDHYLNVTMSRYITIHFSGSSHSYAPWQNFCWVFQKLNDEIEQYVLDNIKSQIVIFAKEKYRQDSIAWTEGTTELV